jgi:hypothetical protein
MGVYLRKLKPKVVRPLLLLGLLTSLLFAVSTPSFAQISGRISAQDIYENPDDHELNLNYAKQEIRRGEMLNAASALERMLYANPNWHSSRLLYAAVLYRLDDPKAAMRELSLLKGRDLNPQQTETYTRYLSEFQTPIVEMTGFGTAAGAGTNSGLNPVKPISGNFALGLRGDNNAGNALTDEGFGFSNRGDVSLHVQGRLRLVKPISADETITARATIGGQIRRHETFNEADYDVIDLQAGVSARPTGKGRLSLDIDGRRVNVSGEKYLEQIGPRITYGENISDNTRVVVSLSAYSQNYSVLPNASLEDERDGIKTRFQLGLQTKLSNDRKLTVSAGHDTKTAEIVAFAYSGPHASVSYEHSFESKTYLKTQLRVRQLNFRGNLNSSGEARKDTRVSFRQSIGLPLSKIAPKANLENVDLEFGFNHNERLSNFNSNDFDNSGVDVKLKFSF